MDEIEELLPLLVASHDWIAGRDTLLWTPCPVGNSPEFMPLYNSFNRDILHSLRFHCALSRFFLDGEGTDEEERNIRFSFSTPKQITRGLKRI